MSILLATPQDALLEVAHAAHRLGYTQDHVRRLIRDHKLKAIRFDKRWRIDRADLEAYIDAHRRATEEALRGRQATPFPFPHEVSR